MSEREQSVLELLKGLRGLEPLKQLFWSELNYDRVNQPLSRRNWNQTASNALAEDPILFAGGGQNNDFHVVYSRLPQSQLLLGQERPVVNQLLKEHPYGLFIFSNQAQDHWHFINVKYDEEAKKRRLFRRISISPEERLRTASERVAMLDLQSIQPDMFGLQPLDIQSKHDEAFDVDKVTDEFFRDYEAQFRQFEQDLLGQYGDHTWSHDYSLQFLNRCMFIYFIQRKGWLGNNPDFLSAFWKSYQRSGQRPNSFVDNWLKVLFFEAFCDKPTAHHTHFPPDIRDALSLAPYLNGGLFTPNKFDLEYKAVITDRRFEEIHKFLESYNFTIAEDSPLDKEVAVDPEMIGKVYESLVNVSDEIDERGEAGIFYTPRTEIDLMCRLSLVDHLANHLGEGRKELLYQLVFALEPDEKTDADKAVATAGIWSALNERLHDITLLDPACGSGSFLVGMLNIMDDLQERANRHLGIAEEPYERKKRIIGQSLYGVDVMEWACHVAELRLWLALIIDAEIPPAELHVRKEPLLPHFTFKIRQGDSLVQEIGGVNFGHKRETHGWSKRLTDRIDNLKDEKLKFYNNDKTRKYHSLDMVKQEERTIFQELLEHRMISIENEIKTLNQRVATPQTQLGMIGLPQKPLQAPLDVQNWKRESEQKQAELVSIRHALTALHNSPQIPFVWDIAFVEIFESEKDGFDIVIGNPPYVRQESIAAPVVNGVQITPDKKEYKAKLALSVYQSFPHFFGYKARSNTVAHKIDAKSDLYIYFYIHGLSLLNENGSFCFITSNSWLDVGYGADLQEFLLKHSHVKLILDINEAEELLRQLRREKPNEYERITNLRDGIRTVKPSSVKGTYVFCQAGRYQQLFLLDEKGAVVTRDIPRILGTIKCNPEIEGLPLPKGYNAVVMNVKRLFAEEVKHRQAEREYTPSLTQGQRYVLRELRALFNATEDEDIKAQINILEAAFRGTMTRALVQELNKIRRNGIAGQVLFKSLGELYYQHNMRDLIDRRSIQMEDHQTPVIICSEGLG